MGSGIHKHKNCTFNHAKNHQYMQTIRIHSTLFRSQIQNTKVHAFIHLFIVGICRLGRQKESTFRPTKIRHNENRTELKGIKKVKSLQRFDLFGGNFCADLELESNEEDDRTLAEEERSTNIFISLLLIIQ